MRELDDVLRAYRLATARGGDAGAHEGFGDVEGATPLILASVVRASAGAGTRVGARMLLGGARHLAGALGAGLEPEVIDQALERTEQGPALLECDAGEDGAHALLLPQGGAATVLLERLDPDSPTQVVSALAWARRAREPLGIVTVLETDGSEKVGARVLVGADGQQRNDLQAPERAERLAAIARYSLRDPGRPPELLRYDGLEVLVEVVPPPVPLVVFGAGPDVAPVVELAKCLGWEVTVVARCPAAGLAGSFPLADRTLALRPSELSRKLRLGPDTLALLMTHSFAEDVELLAALLPSPVRYLGVLGSRARAERLLQHLDFRDVRPTLDALARLYAPADPELGIRGPHELALALVSALQAFLSGRTGGGLDQDRELDRPRVLEPVVSRTEGPLRQTARA